MDFGFDLFSAASGFPISLSGDGGGQQPPQQHTFLSTLLQPGQYSFAPVQPGQYSVETANAAGGSGTGTGGTSGQYSVTGRPPTGTGGVLGDIFGRRPGIVDNPDPYAQLTSIFPSLPNLNVAASEALGRMLEGEPDPEWLRNLGAQLGQKTGIAATSGPIQSGFTNNSMLINGMLYRDALQKAGMDAYRTLIPVISTTQTLSPALMLENAWWNSTNQAAPDPALRGIYDQWREDQAMAMETASSVAGSGAGCCFIFLEALNGVLPAYVRRGRDEFVTPPRRRGYVWMSRWLVPLMKRSKAARHIVNTILIKPFLIWGKKHYEGGPRWHEAFKPVCWAWFWLWDALGHTVRREDYAA